MKIALEHADQEFLSQLQELGGGTVHELCEAIGVTATAVRQRLSRLQGMGLVSRESVRSGRGRPHHTYQVTEAGQRQLGDNYSELALVLWHELKNIEEPAVRQYLVDRVREALVRQFGDRVKGRSLEERVKQLQTALGQRGFNVEIDQSGPLPILREKNCPYPELASSDASICELEQEVYEGVLGVPVTLTQCCLDGHRCCEFQAGELPEGVD